MQIEGLDQLDNQILTAIRDNARMTYSEIGKQLSISRVSVKNRIQALEEKGIIKGYQTVIDPTALPEGIRFFLDLEVRPEDYENIVADLAASKIIRQIYTVSGDSRIHAAGFSPNARNLEVFANSLLRTGRGVRRISCRTVLATLMDIDGGVDYVRFEQLEHLEDGTTRSTS